MPNLFVIPKPVLLIHGCAQTGPRCTFPAEDEQNDALLPVSAVRLYMGVPEACLMSHFLHVSAFFVGEFTVQNGLQLKFCLVSPSAKDCRENECVT